MNTDFDWIKYGVGMVNMNKGRYKAAADKFNAVLATNPTYGNAYAQLGLIRNFEGMRNEAKALFKKAIDNLPENEIAEYQRGLLCVECGNYDDASDQFLKVLERNPYHVDALINLGIVFGRKGNFDRSEKLINDAYHKDQNRKDGFASLGWIKAEANDWSGALKLMDTDRQMGRLSPPWQVHLAQVYGHTGDFVTAVDLIEHAYLQSEWVKDGYARLGWIKTEFQDWDGAFNLMSKDHKKDRLSPGWQTNLAIVKVYKGEYDDAVKMVEDLYAKEEAAVDGYTKLGWAEFWKTGNDHSLQLLIEKDASLNRLTLEGERIRAIAMSIRGELIPACSLMGSLYSENAILMDGFAVMGWLCIEKGDLETGMALMGKDYRLERLSSVWGINYAYQLARTGQSQRARFLFNEVMETEPNKHDFRIGHQMVPLDNMTKSQFRKMIGL